MAMNSSAPCHPLLVWPIGFLANVFVDPTTMPAWLGAIAQWNPLSATAAAARDLFGNRSFGAEAWIVEHSTLLAIVWPVLLVAIFLPLSVRKFRMLGR
jgi:ABC-2 type transport system permease protein